MSIKAVTTDLQLKKIQVPKGERQEIGLRYHPNIFVRASSRNKKFVFRGINPATGKRTKVVLGEANEGMTIAEAAAKARDIRASKLNKLISKNLTVTDVIDDYHATQTLHLKRPDAVLYIFDRFIVPFLDGKMLGDIETYAITREIERIKATNGNDPARKTLGYICKFFRWCSATGRVKQNPAASLRRDIFNIKPNTRERHLSSHEVVMLFDALKNAPRLEPRTKLAIRILLLTGVRVGELYAAEWQHVDFVTNTWHLPAANTKTNSAITIPLPPQGAALFDELKQLTWNSGLVLGGLSDKAIIRALTRLQTPHKNGLCLLPLDEKLTVHDLRRSFVTFLNELGVMPHIVEKCVNHKMQGVAAVYNRADLLNERREAMTLYANALDAPLEHLPYKEQYDGHVKLKS